jgi:heat shock protein HslJ
MLFIFPITAVIALFLLPTLNTTGNAATLPEPLADSWRMYSFTPDGRDPVDVWKHGFALHVNETKIGAWICNEFGGSVQYVDSSTIRTHQIFTTTSLCVPRIGEGLSIMATEHAFHQGLENGLKIFEKEDTLVLRDHLTNATFVYGKPYGTRQNQT